MRIALLAFAIAAVACGDRRSTPPSPGDAPRVRRQTPQPGGAVYPLPPHAIRSDGMGPFKLGQPLATVLYVIPPGPGVERIDIPGVVKLSFIPVEDGRMVVGGDPVMAMTSFVSVFAPEVARTEGGVEVGSTRDALVHALGEPTADPSHVVDPRLVTTTALPGASFVVDGDKVIAAVVTTPGPRPDADATSGAEPPVAPACGADPDALVVRTALGGEPTRLDCLTATEAVAAIGDDLVVIATGDRARRLATLHLPGLIFAGPSRVAGKDDIVGVTVRRDDKQVVWSLVTARWDAGRLIKTLDEPAYQLTTQSVSWPFGAKLDDLDLVLDVETHTDTLVASGVLLHRAGHVVRLAVPLAPISLARRKRTAGDTGPTGVGDASVQPLGDAARGPDASPP